MYIGVGTGGGTRGMYPPKFHKLLYKLLTTLCVVSDCVCPPNQKVFPTPDVLILYSHDGHHSNTNKKLRTTIIITTPLCTHYLCSWLIPCSSVSPPVSAAPPTLQTEVEESGRPPSSNGRTPHSEDWEHHLLWWGVHRQD